MADDMIQVPKDLRAENDPRAAYGVTVDGIRRYLRVCGWSHTRVARTADGAEMWERPRTRLSVVVSVDPDAPDFRLEIMTAVRRIAEVEGRGRLAVLAELRAASMGWQR